MNQLNKIITVTDSVYISSVLNFLILNTNSMHFKINGIIIYINYNTS